MQFDIPHMIATGVIVLVAVWLVNHASAFQDMSKGKKSLVLFVVLFVCLLILNLLWPYGTGI